MLLGPAGVHPVEVAGEQRRLVPAGAGPDLDDDVLVVAGVLGCERLPQAALQRVEALLGQAQLVLEQGAALAGALFLEELAARVQVALRRLPRPVGTDHIAELRVALRQLDEPLVVGEHGGVGELVLDRGVRLLYLIQSWGEHLCNSYLRVRWAPPARGPGWPRYPPPGRSSGWPTALGALEPSTSAEGSGTTWRRSASGRTCSSARIATSIWSWLGGLVVSICSHSPGFMIALTRAERSRPAPSRM